MYRKLSPIQFDVRHSTSPAPSAVIASMASKTTRFSQVQWDCVSRSSDAPWLKLIIGRITMLNCMPCATSSNPNAKLSVAQSAVGRCRAKNSSERKPVAETTACSNRVAERGLEKLSTPASRARASPQYR